MSASLRATITAALTTFIGRSVLAAYTFLIVPLLPSIINFANGVLGYELTDAQVNAYASKGAVGIAALAAVWLVNLGLFERAAKYVGGNLGKLSPPAEK